MENNDIKKALECCTRSGCSDNETKDCPLKPYEDCTTRLATNALALINKQETEYNELYELLQSYKADSEAYRSYSKTLEKENEALKTLLDESFEAQNTVKADTVRKMQTLIEEKADSCDICLINSNKPIDIIYQISKKQLDQIAKEMLEGEK